MGEYARPKNPQKVPSTKIRVFDGIGGPRTQILKKFNFRGWDISNTVSNDVTDLTLAEKGSLLLRPGMRRLGSEDYTIGWIGQVTIGGLLRYGIIYNNSLTMVDLPQRMGYALIPWPEDDDEAPTDWPTDWEWQTDPVDDILPEDPSLPIEDQVCAISWEWDSSPDTMSFTMPYAGSVTPTSDNWYWKGEGFRPETLTGIYTTDAAWYDSDLLQGGAWDVGPCHGLQWGGLIVTPDGKDADGNWLDPGTYNNTKTLRMSDGTDMEVAITLIVAPPDIAITPASYSGSVVLGDAGNLQQVFGIESANSATLRWELVSIEGDAGLANIVSFSAEEGTVTGGDTENITMTIAGPGVALSVGSHNVVATFRDSVSTDVVDTISITVEVTEVPATCPYGTPPTFTCTANYGTVTFNGLMTYKGSCVWERISDSHPTGSSAVTAYHATTNPTGLFANAGAWQPPASFSYDDIFAAYTAPFWWCTHTSYNFGVLWTIGIAIKTTGATPAGTYSVIWTNPTTGGFGGATIAEV